MSDYLQPEDLEKDKKHSTFFSEVITGKAGGVAGGASIDTATNAVTSQAQKTMPKIMGDAELAFDAQLDAQQVEHASQIYAHEIEHDNQIAAHEVEFISQLQAQGWNPVAGSFEAGGTIVNRRDILWWEAAKAWYSWQGTLPKVVPAGSTPATAGGASPTAWVDRTDGALRDELAGADSVVSIAGKSAKVISKSAYETPVESFDGVYPGLSTISTSGLQEALKRGQLDVKHLKLGDSYYLSSNLTLGDPATENYRDPNNQGFGIFGLSGVNRRRSVIKAAPGTTGTFLKRHNLASVTLEKFGVDGSNLVDVGLDIRWIGGAPSAAPSVESVFRDIFISECKVAGLVADGMYDSTFDSILSIGSPIAISMVGGGGQMSLTNSVTAGIVNVGVQNMGIIDCALLGGLAVHGAADNYVEVVGTQVFPAQVNVSTPSYTQGLALSCMDAAGYGAKIKASSSYFFGTGSCMGGVFSHAGGIFECCVFDWSPSSPFFSSVSAGADGKKPHFKFVNCDFRQANTPYGTNPSNYTWEMVNCTVSGVLVQRAGNSIEGTWTPTLVGSDAAGSNTYSVQTGMWFKDGNVCHAFFDVGLSDSSGMSGVLRLSGLPFLPSGTAPAGPISIDFFSGVTLPAGYTQLSGATAAGQLAVPFFASGSGMVLTTLDVSSAPTGARISGVVIYPV